MDPQSVSFTPRDDIWRIHSDMLRVQQTQAEHADRLARLERRQDEDARVKSVWGTSSPFPSVLGGTPQQVPLQQPTADAFSGFDDQSNNLLSSLHLDADEEPRRLGTTSRANSVRFDETANQGHWSHASRSSMDLIPRTGSSLGGHPMTERSYSHKSDGRQSSAAASVHSATSGRANSLGLDSSFPVGTPALEVPRLAPGLFILGSVPAIIRCWLNRNFKHDSLLYAAVCTGSYTSCLDLALITKLGFESEIRHVEDGNRKIKLELYLPEAIPYPASSRSGSPTPQLPSLTVDFTVVETLPETDEKTVKVFLGSDLLRAHNADILLSSNTLTLFDDDRSKLSVPLVRPEDDRAFKTLQVTSSPWLKPSEQTSFQTSQASTTSRADAPEKSQTQSLEGLKAASGSPAPAGSDSDRNATVPSSDDGTASVNERRSLERPAWGPSSRNDSKESATETESSAPNLSRTGSSPAIWNNWRRPAERSNSMDWANAGKAPSSDTYQRRDTGIKVLKPIRTSSRTPSSAAQGPASASTPTTQSRFFDEGRRRVTSVSSASTGVVDTQQQPPQPKRTISTDLSKLTGSAKDGSKPRSANPVGGASAFSWLKNGQK
ncbi:hypothetical protein GTA08_BOTSDO00924 [Botryosphaeria dothidea]|uniref:Ubiquitin carboxyl-terminal hydrolase 19 protein n=1 Tax=Botryosphaeria dothidea TaxID=55169 RepID=A0A8H4J9G2_9PEZI|nr:hypothetical protein GTA08_BOTSDO00924 [Botryosphaeria dothidea]